MSREGEVRKKASWTEVMICKILKRKGDGKPEESKDLCCMSQFLLWTCCITNHFKFQCPMTSGLFLYCGLAELLLGWSMMSSERCGSSNCYSAGSGSKMGIKSRSSSMHLIWGAWWVHEAITSSSYPDMFSRHAIGAKLQIKSPKKNLKVPVCKPSNTYVQVTSCGEEEHMFP